jgi:hypothetical protein
VLSASRNSEMCADASCAPIGTPWPSTTTMHFVPFPRRVFPTAWPPFSLSQRSRPRMLLPSPRACVRPCAPARLAMPATRHPALPTSADAANRWNHPGIRRADRAIERLLVEPRECLPRNGDSEPTVGPAHHAAASAQETTPQSASTARR